MNLKQSIKGYDYLSLPKGRNKIECTLRKFKIREYFTPAELQDALAMSVALTQTMAHLKKMKRLMAGSYRQALSDHDFDTLTSDGFELQEDVYKFLAGEREAKTPTNPRVSDLFANYIEARECGRVKHNSRVLGPVDAKFYDRRQSTVWNGPHWRDVYARRIDKKILSAWVRKEGTKRGWGKDASTWSAYYAGFSALWTQWETDNGKLGDNPAEGLAIIDPNLRKKNRTKAYRPEIDLPILQAIGRDHDSELKANKDSRSQRTMDSFFMEMEAYIILLNETGIRRDFTASLKVNEIYLDDGPVPYILKSMKHETYAAIPLSDLALATVKRLLPYAKEGYLFPVKPLTGKLKDQWTYPKMAGLKMGQLIDAFIKANPDTKLIRTKSPVHSFRAAFATRMDFEKYTTAQIAAMLVCSEETAKGYVDRDHTDLMKQVAASFNARPVLKPMAPVIRLVPKS